MFKDILLPVDLGDLESSAKALYTALGLCKSEGARLHVLTVVPGYTMSIVSQYFPEDFEEKVLADAGQRLEAFVANRVPAEIPSQVIVANGTVYQEILEAAQGNACDLIVMASHRPALKDYLLGPNAARVVRHADCSVMAVRG